MKISNKIYPLTLSLLLFSACSTKNIETENNKHNRTISHVNIGIDSNMNSNMNSNQEITQSTTYDGVEGDFAGNYQLMD
ncbi:MAG TPA: hypothetical protein ENK76_05705, partial [Campylobacterales bacterium]|nr:hypothetical protein [Campylobacterales bacterium]